LVPTSTSHLDDVPMLPRNNHLRVHRQQLREATKHLSPPVRLLALEWALDKPQAELHRLMAQRIAARGRNHQSLRADADRTHENVLWKFLAEAEALGEEEADVVVEMDVAAGPEEALRKAVDACVDVLGLERPSEEKIAEALKLGMAYKPAALAAKETDGEGDATQQRTPSPSPTRKTGPKKPPRYYALLPELDLEAVVARAMRNASEDGKKFWAHLTENDRVLRRPHVTLVHKNGLPGREAMWERCAAVDKLPAPPEFVLRASDVVWDGRVMALAVDNVALSSDPPSKDPGGEGAKFLLGVDDELKKKMHVTVGTREKDVNPYEAGGLVEKWRSGKSGEGIGSVSLGDKGVMVRAGLKGLFS
jgi:tRNA ligase